MRIINTTDLMPPDWKFLADNYGDESMAWETHSGLRRTALERAIPRPHIGRWRAALSAARSARADREAVLVSHLPLMAAATNLLRQRICPDVPQIAFSFNFTEVPTGPRRQYLRRALRGVQEFVVFSRYEIQLYSQLFDIPVDRLHFMPWAMHAPAVDHLKQAPFDRPYLVAVGGEGRDYGLLARVMEGLPDIRMVVIARPHSIKGIQFPSNVKVFENLPARQTWSIAAASQGMVIPLLSDRTACGHITLVGAQLLGIPLAITRSVGITDYANDGVNARLCSAGDAKELESAIAELASNSQEVKDRARTARVLAERENSPRIWCDYLRGAIQRIR
jgi:glycosyltransferase involved in cell wall biosynthesis